MERVWVWVWWEGEERLSEEVEVCTPNLRRLDEEGLEDDEDLLDAFISLVTLLYLQLVFHTSAKANTKLTKSPGL